LQNVQALGTVAPKTALALSLCRLSGEIVQMPIILTPDQVRSRRLAGQCLHKPQDKSSIVEVVRSVCGINAQRVSAMMLSLRARIRGLEPGAIDYAISERHGMARTWTMRGTIHLHDAADINWLVGLLGPVSIAGNKRRYAELGLSEEILDKGLKEIRTALSKAGPLTRWEIVDKLSERGFVLDRKSQAPIHLIQYAALRGLVCNGPDRANGEPTYVLVDEWLEKKAEGSKKTGLAGLVERYLAAYGPADMNDFASWSGIPISKAREAWQSVVSTGSIVEGRLGKRSLWFLDEIPGSKAKPADSRKPVVKLLPAFDSYVLGYAARELVVPPERYKDVYRGGLTVATVMVDGTAAGIWRHDRRGKRMEISVSPFNSFDRKILDLISEEAQDIGRFMGLATSLTYQ
jgi:DNA glycosylase AlkZ-like